MVNNNGIPIEINKKPIETVYEIKGDEYKVPSFEEFMKSYERDEKLSDSYESELVGGHEKGYGPCYSCGNYYADFYIVLKAE